MVWLIVLLATSSKVALWPHASNAIRDGALFVGPVAAGLAAWVAGRGRRTGTVALLVTTPRSPAIRELATWAATAGWGVLGWTLGAAMVLFQVAIAATWGAPLASPLIIALLVTAASATWGYLAGMWLRGRFTAPLSAVGVFAFLIVPTVLGHPVQNISVFSLSYASVFVRTGPDLAPLHAALLLTLTVLALACIVLKHHPGNIPGWGMALAGAGVSVALLVVLMGAEPQTEVDRIPYEPLCAQGGIEVCIHPAYQAAQAETVDVIERLMRPLVGVPGAPVRAEQVAFSGEWGLTEDGVLRFELYESVAFLGGGKESLASRMSGALTYGLACGDDAQEVVRGWLLQQAGEDPTGCQQAGTGGACTGVSRRLLPDVERFAALEPDVRDAWLHDNYAVLIAGRLSLEDLP